MAVLRDVKVLFCNVTNVDDFSGKYQIVASMTEEQVRAVAAFVWSLQLPAEGAESSGTR